MEWREPSLVEYQFRFGSKGRAAVARLGFPRIDQAQISGLKDSDIRLARGEDGLQALTIASETIRRAIDRLREVSSDIAPYEIVFPRYLPFCCGLEFHRKLCKIADAEIKKKGKQLKRRRLARKKSGLGSPARTRRRS